MKMDTSTFQSGDRVRVICYCPFKGLRGTVRRVSKMASEDDEMPFLFYQIDLEGAYIKHPVWFQNEEVELIIGVSG